MSRPLYTVSAFKVAYTTARIFPAGLCRFMARLITRGLRVINKGAIPAQMANLAPVTGLQGKALWRFCLQNTLNFGSMLSDYFVCSARESVVAEQMLGSWSGWEHMEAARARGKGVILVTAHLGNWELGGALLSLHGLPVTVITADEPDSGLTDWRDRYRRQVGIKTIAVGPGREFAFVEMMTALRQNECVAMLVDRPYADTGSPVSIFGRETEFSTAPALLWQHTGAAVVPAFVVNIGGGKYKSFVEPEVQMKAGADPREALRGNTQALASAFESVIRRFPDQWYNYVPIWK